MYCIGSLSLVSGMRTVLGVCGVLLRSGGVLGKLSETCRFCIWWWACMGVWGGVVFWLLVANGAGDCVVVDNNLISIRSNIIVAGECGLCVGW